MILEILGYNDKLEKIRKKAGLAEFDIGRVISEHKERYVVKSERGEFEAEVIGNIRYSAESRSDFPAVGDWVAISEYDEGKLLIHGVIPRINCIERQSPGKYGEKQIIAANIDFGFIIQAVDRDFNINRIERYMTLCYNSNVEPVILLNKIDLIKENKLSEMLNDLKKRVKNVSVIAISNETRSGYSDIKDLVQRGKTFCLLGSSGVGKSTLVNNLSGKERMKTNTISEHTKGRHVTSHRELVIIEDGGILIDNPGMREVGMTELKDGTEKTYDLIKEFAKKCKYKDCSHINEKGCAVIEAVENKIIVEAYYQNWVKIEKERAFFESTLEERRKKDKEFGKMVKEVMKIKKKGNRKY